MEQEERSISHFVIGTLVFFYLYLVTDMYFYSMLGIAMFAFFSVKFFNEIGKKIELRDLIIIIALLQWIIGPLLAYRQPEEDLIYYMAVNEKEYMNFVFPAMLLFIVALYMPFLDVKIDQEKNIEGIKEFIDKYPYLDLLLILAGFISTYLMYRVSYSLFFFLYLIGNTKFIGVFFLLLGKRRYKWILFVGVIGWLVSVSVVRALFHDLILWSGFIFIVLAFMFKISTIKKIALFIILGVAIFLIQAIKHQIRERTREDRDIQLFTDMIVNNLQDTKFLFSKQNLKSSITRLNQGWIIARIMNHVPAYEPFANGETFTKGLKSVFVPRFLSPEKEQAGGLQYFERFTGEKLVGVTSMDISLIGEAYANFGKNGGIVVMFFLGLFLNFILFIFKRNILNHPTLILWLPFVFLYAVKAESDFTSTMNYVVKASMALVMIFYGLRLINIKF
jgi:hypothetical protein